MELILMKNINKASKKIENVNDDGSISKLDNEKFKKISKNMEISKLDNEKFKKFSKNEFPSDRFLFL